MGLFSRLRKSNPEDVYRELGEKIVALSALYSERRLAKSEKIAAAIEAEFIFLILHLIDLVSFEILGDYERNIVFDEIWHVTISKFLSAKFQSNNEKEYISESIDEFVNAFNSRQDIYSQCDELTGDHHPHVGTKLFAFSFYVNQAVRHSKKKGLDDLLSGRRELRDSDLDYLPGPDEVIPDSIFIGVAIKELNIRDKIKKLKGQNIERIHSEESIDVSARGVEQSAAHAGSRSQESDEDSEYDATEESDIKHAIMQLCNRIDGLGLGKGRTKLVTMAFIYGILLGYCEEEDLLDIYHDLCKTQGIRHEEADAFSDFYLSNDEHIIFNICNLAYELHAELLDGDPTAQNELVSTVFEYASSKEFPKSMSSL